MSELDFDDISELLGNVLDDKPIEVPDDQPATPEEVAVVAEIAQPAEADDILGDFMNDLADEQASVIITPPEPDSVEAIEAEVTQCVTSPTQEEEFAVEEAMEAEAFESTPELETAVETAAEEDGVQFSEHVFSEPTEVAAIPLPTFTTDEIADSLDIRNFATLVTLNTARWHAKVKDRKAAKDAADASGADAEAFEARKRLLAGCDAELRAVHKAIDTARAEHYRLTLPWSTVGVNDVGKRAGGRLMPNTLFLEYTTIMAQCHADMTAKLATFEKKYPSLLGIAATKLGTAYNPSEYPNPSSIAQHFRLSFDFNPIPVGTDFKGLQDAQIQKLGTALNKKTRTMLENAMQDAWKQLYEAVQHAQSRLSNPDSTFHATLITKLQDHAKMLTHLNATKDPRMEEVRKMVEDNLTKWDAKDIRDDDALRKRLSESADEIVERMEEIADA